jgi:uncharacterized protein YcbX
MSEVVGSVKALWRFPVKSMLGERLETAELTEDGFVGDRTYALIDGETGEVLSGKTPRLGPSLFDCRAAFVDAPMAGEAQPPVRITLADGSSVTTDAPAVDAVLSQFLGHEVRLERAPPAGAYFDLFPVSVLTTSTLARLTALRPESRFDERRFRMNVIVRTDAVGFVENAWTGQEIQIGDSVRLAVELHDPRCVMTTLAQDDLPRDSEVLRTIARHNRLQVAGGLYPCAGVYAVVASAGSIRQGARVSLTRVHTER